MQELINGLQKKKDKLRQCIKSLHDNGIESAQAEMDYKILLAKECLKLRESGMPIGMIELTVYGIPAVAEARFKRDAAKAVFMATQEAINCLKLELRIDDAQIAREWGNAD